MTLRLFRWLWRLATLVLILGAAYLTTFVAFPFLDRYAYKFFAVLGAYAVLAYVLLPLASRFWRVVFKPNHIPLYVVTPDGWPADPVNIAIIAKNKRQLKQAMERAGWLTADNRSVKTGVRLLVSIVLNRPYPRAPFTALYLFGRPFDIGFQKPRTGSTSARARHHVRFWKLSHQKLDPYHREHLTFWHTTLARLRGEQGGIWIGAALDDTGPIGVRWRDLKLTHKNDPNTNRERDLIVEDLVKTRAVQTDEIIRAGKPFRFHGQTLGNRFICDGNIRVISLR